MMSMSPWRVCRTFLPIVLLALCASACSDDETPTNPSGVPNMAGLWTGTYRIRTCTDTVGGTPGTLCTPAVGTPLIGATAPVRLSLQQTDDRVVGNLEFSGWVTRAVIVTGIAQSDGGLVLNGETTWTDAACPTTPNRLTMTPWTTRLNRAQDAMTGDFRVTGSVRVSACVFADVAIDADTVQLARQ